MSYAKENNQGRGFSWTKHLNHLLRNHPDSLEEIIHAKLKVKEQQSPEQADHYRSLGSALTQEIDKASIENEETFGFDDAQEITRNFLKENGLEDWLNQDSPERIVDWCGKCELFTDHYQMEQGYYCSSCDAQKLQLTGQNEFDISDNTQDELDKLLFGDD